MSFTWGTVTATGPLRVQLDGDAAAVPITPDSLVDPNALSAGDRVRCELSDRRLIVHGAAAGVGVPSGTMVLTASSAASNGWLLCQGQAVSRSTYAALFAAIGTTYGVGNGTTTFNLPDMRGRIAAGVDSAQTEFATPGKTGGEKTHLLTVAEMPSHTHTQNAHSHGWGFRGGWAVQAGMSGAGTANDSNLYNGTSTNSATATNQNTGGGGAHNNLQPYVALNYLIKA